MPVDFATITTLDQLHRLDPRTLTDEELQRAQQLETELTERHNDVQRGIDSGGIDAARGAPARVRAAVGASPARDRLAAARNFYPDAMQIEDDIIAQDDPARPAFLINPRGPDVGDVASILPEIGAMTGAVVGAIPRVGRPLQRALSGPLRSLFGQRAGEGLARGVRGAVGSGIGAAGGMAAGEAVGQSFGGVDTRTTGEHLGDLGEEAAINAAMYPAGEMLAAGVSRLGRLGVSRLGRAAVPGSPGSAATLEAAEAQRVTPYAGMVGGPTVQNTENILGMLPGGSPVRTAVNTTNQQVQDRAGALANTLDPTGAIRSPEAAGESLRRGVTAWRDDFLSETRRLAGDATTALPPDAGVRVPRTYQTLLGPQADYVGAEALGREVGDAMHREAAQLRRGVHQSLVDAANTAGIPSNNITTLLRNQDLPVRALQSFRDSVGNRITDEVLVGRQPDRWLRELHRSLTGDVEDALGAVPDGGTALAAWRASDQHWNQGLNTAEQFMSRFSNPNTPAGQAYNRLMSAGGDVSPADLRRMRTELQRVDPQAWDDAVAFKVRSLGHPPSAGGAATGDPTADFSARAFIDNVGRMQRAGSFNELFNGTSHRALGRDIGQIATLARSMDNTSNFNHWGLQRVFGALSYATLFGAPAGHAMWGMAPEVSALATGIGTAGSLLVAPNVASRLLESRTFVHWLANVPIAPNTTARQVTAHMLQLGNLIDREQNPSMREAIREYGRSMMTNLDRSQGAPPAAPTQPEQPAAP